MNHSQCSQYRPIRTISVTSGKGGVGKSSLTANIAYELASKNKKVLLFDADLGMANLDIMFGVYCKEKLLSVLNGEKKMQEIICRISDNIDLIPGGSGIYEMNGLSPYQKKAIIDQISDLEGLYDYLIIDTAPGIDEKVLYFNAASQDILIVLTPDPSSLSDSYALIKLLHLRYKQKQFNIVCNLANDKISGFTLFRKLSDICDQFLNVSLNYVGSIPFDTSYRNVVKSKGIIAKIDPKAPSSLAIKSIVDDFFIHNSDLEIKGGIEFFWHQLVEVA
jgi:flagellar biosynthesis protein FlhG